MNSRILRRIKIFLLNNGQKNVFVAEYFLLALKLYTVVFKRSDRSIWSDDTNIRVDLFVTCADGRSIRPLQFFVDFRPLCVVGRLRGKGKMRVRGGRSPPSHRPSRACCFFFF